MTFDLDLYLQGHSTLFWLGIQHGSIVWVIMRRRGVSSERRRSSCSSFVYSAVCSGTDQRKHQSSASLAFVRGIHRLPVNSPHKGPVTRQMFPFDDVIMQFHIMHVTAVLFVRVCEKVLWRFNTCNALKTKGRQFDNFVVTGGTVSCRNDNLLCHQ